ncbi:hypothetical protein AB0C27_36510 [Nonomuraea sp. NPDC048882]|uniref:hypothetical protein n=1 Tax=unclassified Nonomuraea TaxID=2593643 RepID=UPI0033D4F1F2
MTSTSIGKRRELSDSIDEISGYMTLHARVEPVVGERVDGPLAARLLPRRVPI